MCGLFAVKWSFFVLCVLSSVVTIFGVVEIICVCARVYVWWHVLQICCTFRDTPRTLWEIEVHNDGTYRKLRSCDLSVSCMQQLLSFFGCIFFGIFFFSVQSKAYFEQHILTVFFLLQ